MALYADGGLVGSKPYAASGNYINRMSDFCGSCRYDPRESVGERACPFNALYWHFMARHRDLLGGNARLRTVYATFDRLSADRRAALLGQADRFLQSLA
jgi:deoxyribodipyrimidine photolyase-related protein